MMDNLLMLIKNLLYAAYTTFAVTSIVIIVAPNVEFPLKVIALICLIVTIMAILTVRGIK